MDAEEYRLIAVRAWRAAAGQADPDLARQYRSLASAYLALAHFRDHAAADLQVADQAAPPGEVRGEV